MSGALIGTFDELIVGATPEVESIATRLRDLVFDVDPDAVEVVRLGDRAASYGCGPKKMVEGYAYITPHAHYVNLGFYRGADLDDPAGLLEGTGSSMRHVKIQSDEAADDPALRVLLTAAVTERRSALGV